MQKRFRRPSTNHERLTPCECCGYPVSDRHHLLPFAQFGDTELTSYLCPNCHDLYHLMESGGSSRRRVLVLATLHVAYPDRFDYLNSLWKKAYRYKCDFFSICDDLDPQLGSYVRSGGRCDATFITAEHLLKKGTDS